MENSALLDRLVALTGDLPRQGPGCDTASLDALRRLDLAPVETIADMGCGTGATSRLLAAATGAHVVALDLQTGFLARLAGHERIMPVCGDMLAPPIEDGSIDLVWAESSAYAIGFATALESWRPLLRDGGAMLVSELCWLVAPADRPQEAAAFWAEEYPQMTDVENRREDLRRGGLRALEPIVLPWDDTWPSYYGALEAALPIFAARSIGDPVAASLVEIQRSELDIVRRHRTSFAYVLFPAVTA